MQSKLGNVGNVLLNENEVKEVEGKSYYSYISFPFLALGMGVLVALFVC